jgi:hypothetical protein
MLEHEKDRQLNALLDSLLSAYSAVEPRPGLDTRIRAGLRARAAQQKQQWMLIVAATAAIVFLVALIRTRTLQPSVPNRISVQKSFPDPSRGYGEVIPSSSKAARQLDAYHRAKVRDSNNNLILLQVANAMHGADSLTFEQEKLYLSPAPQEEPDSIVEPQTPAPGINIQDLGVQTIEIKELPSAKGTDSKGNL